MSARREDGLCYRALHDMTLPGGRKDDTCRECKRASDRRYRASDKGQAYRRSTAGILADERHYQKRTRGA